MTEQFERLFLEQSGFCYDRLQEMSTSLEQIARGPEFRPCTISGSGEARFHAWTQDADGEAAAIVEFPDGSVDVIYYKYVRFTDRD